MNLFIKADEQVREVEKIPGYISAMPEALKNLKPGEKLLWGPSPTCSFEIAPEMDNYLFECVCAADLYSHKCTQQEEKFKYYQRNGIIWSWEECQASYEILRESCVGSEYWDLRKAARL